METCILYNFFTKNTEIARKSAQSGRYAAIIVVAASSLTDPGLLTLGLGDETMLKGRDLFELLYPGVINPNVGSLANSTRNGQIVFLADLKIIIT